MKNKKNVVILAILFTALAVIAACTALVVYFIVAANVNLGIGGSYAVKLTTGEATQPIHVTVNKTEKYGL